VLASARFAFVPAFSSETYLPLDVVDRITDLRVNDPHRMLIAASRREQRETLTRDGKLNILAADHPARGVVRVGDETIAMANRHDYLARIVRVLVGNAVDGVMATMDVLQDLLLLHELVRESGGPAFLDDKVLLASLNRGGLAGTAWELDDPITGADAETCKRYRLDGAKLLLRIADDDPCSLKTMSACSAAITRMNAVHLPTFLEPLPVRRDQSGYKVIREAPALARIAGIASALGDSSHLLWLKLPYTERYETVARATTLPILLLGGESVGDPRPLLDEIVRGLRAGSTVRGALVGRNVLYPGADDPFAVANAVDGIVHRGWDTDAATAALEEQRGKDMDAITRWLG